MELLGIIFIVYILFMFFSSGSKGGKKCPSCGKKSMIVINTWRSPTPLESFCGPGLYRYDTDYECQNCKHRETDSICK